jgi:hypothetical protein
MHALWGTLILVVSGLVVFQIVPYLNDTYQLPYPGYVALWFLFLFVMARGILSLQSNARLVSISIVFVIGIWSSWNEWYVGRPAASLGKYHATQKGISEALVKQVEETFAPNKTFRVGFFLSREEAKELNPRYRVALSYTPWNWTAYLHDGLMIEPLTPADTLYATGTDQELALARAFNDLLPFYREDRKDVASITDYIRRRGIDYVFALGTVWPSEEFIANPLSNLVAR